MGVERCAGTHLPPIKQTAPWRGVCAVCGREYALRAGPRPTPVGLTVRSHKPMVDDDDTCRQCGADGFRLSPRGFCDGCEEHISFLERTGQTD